LCELNGSKVANLGYIKDGYKRSSIHVVGDRSYMDTTMVEIIFLISEVDTIKICCLETKSRFRKRIDHKVECGL
jgi:hypothetical protein